MDPSGARPEPARSVRARSMSAGRPAVVGIAQRQQPRAEPLELGRRFFEPVLGNQRCVGHVALAAQVPFAKMAGGISRPMQISGQRGRTRVQPLSHPATFIGGAAVEIGKDPPTVGILARRQRGP